MELDELHVDELGARRVGQGVPVGAVLPGVRGHLVGLADAARGEDRRLGRERDRPSRRPPVADRSGDLAGSRRQVGDRALHVDIDAGRDGVVLEGPDHLQTGPIEDRSPAFKLTDPIRRFLGVELGHPRVVEELAADHRVPEVDLPRIVRGNVTQRRRDAALGHHRVGLAEERLAHERDAGAGVPRRDRRSKAGPAGADDEDIHRVRLDRCLGPCSERHLRHGVVDRRA
jgi:hypothetical protein